MPKRRAESLSRKTKAAKRVAASRENENEEEREERLETLRLRNQERRDNENEEEREERLETLRLRNQERRENENEEEREERLETLRLRNQERRENENEEEREERLETLRLRNQERRENENEEEREERLETLRLRDQERRENENEEEREERLETLRLRNQERRDNENEEEREERLETLRLRNQERRENENEEEREERLETLRLRNQERRENENEEEREERLETLRLRDQERRDNENEEERAERLERLRLRDQERRDDENEEERAERLERVRMRDQTRKENENEEERGQRLELMRRKKQDRRSSSLSINWTRAAFSYDATKNYSSYPEISIGQMDTNCQHCLAKKWKGEAPGLCCSGGKIRLPTLTKPPDTLCRLLTDDIQFRNNLWKYNSAFMMTSFGADNDVTEPGFFTTYKIQGQCYHLIGGLLPVEEAQPKYAQVYFMGGGQEEAHQRCSLNKDVKLDTINVLQDMLHTTHPYIQSFKFALEQMNISQRKLVIHADKRPAGEHERRFNAPVVNEVAIIMVGEEHGKRDIVLQQRDEKRMRIRETHRSYDCLQYPLIFPRGEDGYNFGVYKVERGTGRRLDKKVSCKDFYAYRFMVRDAEFNQVLRFKQVTSQFMVDMYAKIESERLLYVRLNQKRLRADEYIHLRDAMNTDGNINNVGQHVILPSSFNGSPRNMHERTQDAMAYVRKYGRPDLFITFTCNPKWKEILQELFEGQSHYDRHDLTARVFHEKQKKLLWLLKDGKIFGDLRCWMYTIEWQKRGLPHSHTLIWCKNRIHPDETDNIISAELPDPEEDPEMFDIVKTQMIHGPCGHLNRNASCMRDGKCTKRYPCNLLRETQTGHDGYPRYRRRGTEDGGFKCKVKIRGGAEVDVDNRWVVPHNKVLSKTFGAHINVESCNSVKSIQYICKYVNKGSDMAVFGVEQEGLRDEIEQFQTGRYISSNEGIWRIFGFDIHQRYPTVVNLAVHLENGQRVYFTAENAEERARIPPETTLTAFFKLCQQDNFAKTLLYQEVPAYYTWNNKIWFKRKQGRTVQNWPNVFESDAIGRVYGVHPNQRECFYVRLLLQTVRGPQSFQDLRSHGDEICTSYREACMRFGLLEDDQQWVRTLEEASVLQKPVQLRQLFVVMLVTCDLTQPVTLWESFRESMSEDFLYQARRQNPSTIVDFDDEIFNRALIDLKQRVQSMGVQDLSTFGIPEPIDTDSDNLSEEYIRETTYNTNELTVFINENEPKLIESQRMVYDVITAHVEGQTGGLFFLNAPGGTGKTFVTNLLLAKVRKEGKIALAVASSGIAATLLNGGRTAHSTFKLPLDLAKKENPVCSIKRGTSKAKLLKECKLIIWDEATMSHKGSFEAVHRLLQDLRENNDMMGGVTVVLSGDFRQTLPVIPKGTKADEINACLKSSHLWPYVNVLNLTVNLRVYCEEDADDNNFAKQLLDVGNGQLSQQDGLSELPFGHKVNTEEDLIAKVFPNLKQNLKNMSWISERAILAPKNDKVDGMNNKMLQLLPGEVTCYKSIDTVPDIEQVVNYPVEFLNSLQPAGFPPHILNLKKLAPVILIRNLDPPKLCNGTRLIIQQVLPSVLEATILTGKSAGQNVFIARIPLMTSDLPFQFKRLQFPDRLSFAMSINKSQGQTLKVVGLNLAEPVFSHGQLYVGCSRVGDPKNLFWMSKDGETRTRNVVYKEVLHM